MVMQFGVHLPREASDLIFKIRSCTVRSDLKNKVFSAVFLIFKIRSYSARSDLKNKIARFSGYLSIGMDSTAHKTQGMQEEAQGQDWETILIHAIIHTQEEHHQGPMGQEELSPQDEAIQEAITQVVLQAPAVHLQTLRPHSSQEEQAIPVVLRQLHLQDFLIQEDAPIHGTPLDRSRKALPRLSLPSNYKNCSILDMQQILEAWYDKSTFAIATWRGDAQRYWLTQVLDCARLRNDQWLQSTPSQRGLEAYIVRRPPD